MIKQVIWSSMIDWPNENCTVLFLEGCNFSCSYCHNKGLSKEKTIELESILPRLIERRPFVDHVILSGGEPTISDDFKYIVETLYDNGFKIGIHTNGSEYYTSSQVEKYISFIGLDIKTIFDKYHLYMHDYDLGRFHRAGINRSSCFVSSIKKYLSHIKEFQYEIRTVLDINKNIETLIEIAMMLKNYEVEKWVLQYEFQNNKIIKYNSNDWYKETLEKLNKIIKVDIR